MVGLGLLGRGKPDGGDAQFVQIVQVVLDAREVADAVAVRIGKAVHIHLVGDAGSLQRVVQALAVGAQVGFGNVDGRHAQDAAAADGILPGSRPLQIGDAVTVDADAQRVRARNRDREIHGEFIAGSAFAQLQFHRVVLRAAARQSAGSHIGQIDGEIPAEPFAHSPHFEILGLGRHVPEGEFDHAAHMLELKAFLGIGIGHVQHRHHRHAHHIQILQILVHRGEVEGKGTLCLIGRIGITGTGIVRIDGDIAEILPQGVVQQAGEYARSRTGTALQGEVRYPGVVVPVPIPHRKRGGIQVHANLVSGPPAERQMLPAGNKVSLDVRIRPAGQRGQISIFCNGLRRLLLLGGRLVSDNGFHFLGAGPNGQNRQCRI